MLEAELLAKESLRFGPTIDPLSALTVIRAYCQEVEQLHPELAKMGAVVDGRVVEEVYALAEIAEQCAREGGSNPLRGSRR